MSVEAQGAKDDFGKPRWGLLPYDAVEEVVKVLTYGAAKYKSTIEVLVGDLADWIQQQLLLQNEQLTAIQVKLDTVTDSVGAATKKTSEKSILNLQNVNEKTEGNGQSVNESGSKKHKRNEKTILTVESEMQQLKSAVTYEGAVYKMIDTQSCKAFRTTSAEFAKENCATSMPYTLTTIIQQGSHVDFFVVGATTVLECLKTLSECLKPLQFTLKIPPIISYSENSVVFEHTGDRNWEHGIDFERLFSAAQRHQAAWWQKKEDLDESGYNHLAHATCELLFLLALQLRGRKDLDNRPIF